MSYCPGWDKEASFLQSRLGGWTPQSCPCEFQIHYGPGGLVWDPIDIGSICFFYGMTHPEFPIESQGDRGTQCHGSSAPQAIRILQALLPLTCQGLWAPGVPQLPHLCSQRVARGVTPALAVSSLPEGRGSGARGRAQSAFALE